MLWIAALAWAAPSVDSSEGETSPATVLSDKLRVDSDGEGRIRQTREWTVRIDDPNQVSAGILTPPGLDGASNRGAQVIENVLILPGQVAVGDTFTFKQTTTARKAGQAGMFTLAPDLPVERAELNVDLRGDFVLWTEESGEAAFPSGKHQVVWTQHGPTDSTLAAWSTWTDWFSAGKALNDKVDALVPVRYEAFGRNLASDLTGINPAQAWQRVRRELPLRQGPSSWESVRSANEILNDSAATAAERGLILIGLLRLAGFHAGPAGFSPSFDPEVPWSLPNPSLVNSPAVVVRLDNRTLWIDPSTDSAPTEHPPIAAEHGVWWEPGDLPHPAPHTAIPDSGIYIASQGSLESDGSASWNAIITATGSSEQTLRETLRALDEKGQADLFKRFLVVAHPGIDRWKVDINGLEDQRSLKISLQAHENGALTPKEPALYGNVPSLLAPALAEWMPARTQVNEDLSLTWPSDFRPISVLPPPSVWHRDGSVFYRRHNEGSRSIFSTVVTRRSGHLSPHREEELDAFLLDSARSGWPSLALRRSAPVSREDLESTGLFSAGEAVALEAIASDQKPKKVAKRILSEGPAAVAALDRYSTADPELWRVLLGKAKTDDLRLPIAQALLERDPTADTEVLESIAQGADPVSALQACVYLYPSAETDYHRTQWLAAARSAAGALPTPNSELARIEMEDAVRHGQVDAALRQAALLDPNNPRDQLRKVEVLLLANQPRDTVAGVLSEALHLTIGPGALTAEDLMLAGEWSFQLEDPDQAVDLIFAGAQLDPSAKHWMAAADLAMRAADLESALYATERASELHPADPEIARSLAQTAAFALNEPSMKLGLSRGKLAPLFESWPPAVPELLAIADEHQMRAILEYHDRAVTGNARLLALRAQLRLDAQHMDGVVRDGNLLWNRYSEPRGLALAFAAGAGRLHAGMRVDDLSKTEALSQAVRLEFQLIAGVGNVASSAKANAEDPRERILLEALSSKGTTSDGWPSDVKDPSLPSPGTGWRTNSALGAALGVVAWSDSARMRSGMFSVVPNLLPPPISGLYAVEPRPLKEWNGAQLHRLTGGVIPLFIAIRGLPTGRVFGLGFTEAAAVRALEKVKVP